ncbi:MAG: 6-carboxytetrahydropterin synthase QueD [Candidatus Omnitrophota bacterium]
MYKIKVEADFSSAHNLRGYKGRCEKLHGHNWKVQVTLTKQNLDKVGMVLDFTYLKRELNKILEKLDHKYLNNIVYFKKVHPVRSGAPRRGTSNGVNPTSECIAKYIYDILKTKIPSLTCVKVWESENCSAAYYE